MPLFSWKKYPGRLFLLAIVVVGAGLISWASLRDKTPTAEGQWIQAQNEPEQRSIQADGYLQPLSVVQITAPFDGKIVKRNVQIGDKVTLGAVLIEIDRSDILAEHREAEIAHTRSAEVLDEVKNWENSSSEVLNQKRQVQRSQNSLEIVRTKLHEIQTLYDKGIVPRSELDSAKTELDNVKVELQAAQEALGAVLKKGSATHLRIAQLEHQNRTSKLSQLTERLQRATMLAPADGVVLYPNIDPGAQQVKEFGVGSFVSSKEVVLSLGDVSMFKVSSALDEVDVAQVAVGMPVQITLGSNADLVLRGELSHISAQAKRDGMQGAGMSAAPMYEVQVLVREVPESMRGRVKLGMSAHMQIAPQNHSTVITVPLAAVLRDEASAYVLVQDGRNSVRRDVELGKTLLDNVVVVSGLTEKDFVWLPVTSDSPQTTRLALPGMGGEDE